MIEPKKLSAERLVEIRAQFDWEFGITTLRHQVRDLLAHCDALAAENQVLRTALEFYADGWEYWSDGQRARTALEKTGK